jgi:hypothetical protein
MKDRYIEIRNKKFIDWQFLYDYVVSKGFNLGVESFNMGAQYLVNSIDNIMQQLDSEYELTLLHDKDGNFIKVVT